MGSASSCEGTIHVVDSGTDGKKVYGGTYVQAGVHDGRIKWKRTTDADAADVSSENTLLHWDKSLKVWRISSLPKSNLGSGPLPANSQDGRLEVTIDEPVGSFTSTISVQTCAAWKPAVFGGAFSGITCEERCMVTNETSGMLHFVEVRTKKASTGEIKSILHENDMRSHVEGKAKKKPMALGDLPQASALAADAEVQARAAAANNKRELKTEDKPSVQTVSVLLLRAGETKTIFRGKGVDEAESVKLHIQRHDKNCLGSETIDCKWGKLMSVNEDIQPLENIDPSFLELYQKQRQEHLEWSAKALLPPEILYSADLHAQAAKLHNQNAANLLGGDRHANL